MIFLLKYWKPIIAILTVAGAVLYVYGIGKSSCEQSHLKTSVIAVKEHGKNEAKINRLDDADLDKRLARWVQ